MSDNVLKTFTVQIVLEPGCDLTGEAFERLGDACTDMLDDGDLAVRVQDSLVEAGLPREIVESLHVRYKEVIGSAIPVPTISVEPASKPAQPRSPEPVALEHLRGPYGGGPVRLETFSKNDWMAWSGAESWADGVDPLIMDCQVLDWPEEVDDMGGSCDRMLMCIVDKAGVSFNGPNGSLNLDVPDRATAMDLAKRLLALPISGAYLEALGFQRCNLPEPRYGAWVGDKCDECGREYPVRPGKGRQ